MRSEAIKESKISETSYLPIKPTEKGLIGFASLLLDNKISLNSISVYLTPKGDIRLLFPNKILPNGKKISIYYPINRETYDEMKKAISQKIETVMKGILKDGREPIS